MLTQEKVLLPPSFRHPKVSKQFYPPPNNCVLYLPGYPPYGTKIYDQSVNGNDGTITGATWTRLPSGLWVLDFDGVASNIVIADNASLAFGTSDFTFEVWIKPSVTCGALARIFSKQGAVWVFFRLSGGKVQCNIFDGVDTASVLAVSDLRDAKWHYVAATCDRDSATGFQAYVAGVASGVAVDPTLVGSVTAAVALDIGRYAPGPAEYYKGTIALPRVYTRALSAAEILGHYNQERHLFGV